MLLPITYQAAATSIPNDSTQQSATEESHTTTNVLTESQPFDKGTGFISDPSIGPQTVTSFENELYSEERNINEYPGYTGRVFFGYYKVRARNIFGVDMWSLTARGLFFSDGTKIYQAIGMSSSYAWLGFSWENVNQDIQDKGQYACTITVQGKCKGPFPWQIWNVAAWVTCNAHGDITGGGDW